MTQLKGASRILRQTGRIMLGSADSPVRTGQPGTSGQPELFPGRTGDTPTGASGAAPVSGARGGHPKLDAAPAPMLSEGLGRVGGAAVVEEEVAQQQVRVEIDGPVAQGRHGVARGQRRRVVLIIRITGLFQGFSCPVSMMQVPPQPPESLYRSGSVEPLADRGARRRRRPARAASSDAIRASLRKGLGTQAFAPAA